MKQYRKIVDQKREQTTATNMQHRERGLHNSQIDIDDSTLYFFRGRKVLDVVKRDEVKELVHRVEITIAHMSS